MKDRLKIAIPGFLLIEAMIAILMSILLSSIIVLYLGKSATLRAEIYHRSQALTSAISVMEGLLGDAILSDQRSPDCGVHFIPVSLPICEGVDLVLPSLTPCVQITIANTREQVLVLCSWIGAPT